MYNDNISQEQFARAVRTESTRRAPDDPPQLFQSRYALEARATQTASALPGLRSRESDASYSPCCILEHVLAELDPETSSKMQPSRLESAYR